MDMILSTMLASAPGGGVNFLKVIVILVIVAVFMWFINTKCSKWITGGWLTLINVVAAVIVGLWLCNIFGIWDWLSSVHS